MPVEAAVTLLTGLTQKTLTLRRRAPHSDPSPYAALDGLSNPVDRRERGRKVFACDLGIVLSLHVDEVHVAEAQCARQAKSSVGGDAALAVDDFVDPACWYIDRLRDPILRNAHRLKKLRQQDLAGVGGREICHCCLRSVVVDQFDVGGSAGAPGEADAPPVVDADPVLTGSVAGQFLQSVTRRYPQVIDVLGRIDEDELVIRESAELRTEPLDVSALPDRRGVLVSERADNKPIVTSDVINGKALRRGREIWSCRRADLSTPRGAHLLDDSFAGILDTDEEQTAAGLRTVHQVVQQVLAPAGGFADFEGVRVKHRPSSCGILRTFQTLFRIVQMGADMSAEAAETATFIPEDPDELASVVGFLATHERLRGTVASPSYALVGIGEHDRIELPRSVHQALTKVVAALHAGKAVTIAPQT